MNTTRNTSIHVRTILHREGRPYRSERPGYRGRHRRTWTPRNEVTHDQKAAA